MNEDQKEKLKFRYRQAVTQFRESSERRAKLLHLLAEEEKVYRQLQTKLVNAESDLFGGPI